MMKLMKILSILILFFITSCVYNPQRPDIVESSSAQRVQTVQAAIVVDVKSIIISGDRETGAIAGGVIGAAAMGFLFNLWGANALMQFDWMNHLIVGGFAFGIVFMATDPVTASHTNTGKFIYGFLGGFLGILIRMVNPAYPEGIMLAILIANVFAPLIDHMVIQSNINRRLKRLKTA